VLHRAPSDAKSRETAELPCAVLKRWRTDSHFVATCCRFLNIAKRFSLEACVRPSSTAIAGQGDPAIRSSSSLWSSSCAQDFRRFGAGEPSVKGMVYFTRIDRRAMACFEPDMRLDILSSEVVSMGVPKSIYEPLRQRLLRERRNPSANVLRDRRDP
jgi:hypothetical protein